MYQNRNNNVVQFKHRYMADGVLVTLPIDDFPVSDDSLFNEAGWPISTLGLIDRFTRDHVDEDIIKKIASRAEAIEQSSVDDGLTDDERLMLLRPSWVQTASEFADFQERIYQIRQSMTTSSDSVKNVDNSDNLQAALHEDGSSSPQIVTA